MKPLAAIAELVRERTGLDPETVGERALAAAVRGRMRAAAIADEPAYLDRLLSDGTEQQALVEAVVVPETWFFRDTEPFVLLGRWALARWNARRAAGEPLALLSLPCATGEEAWSMAIAVAAAGVPAGDWQVEAYDVSESALAIARAAVYGPRALRGRPPRAAWARYLLPRPDGGVAVDPALRPGVRFATGNLVDAPRRFAGRRFDCVFSRNLLIYLDPAARAAAFAAFATLVRPGGLLVLGHAETLPAGTPGFVREGPPAAFAWRRVEGSARAAARHAAGGRKASTPVRPAGAAKAVRGTPARAIAVPRPVDPSPAPADAGGAAGKPDVAAAQTLADAGRLEEAAAVLTAALAAVPTDAAAHALLGIVRSAQGREAEAAASLRRALYLDPQREDALLHLAVLLERAGDRAGAARLRRRAQQQATPASEPS